ncbi:MAG: YwbE family protein [Proteobacteria bacterium]|nr:YwbE family protein [Pseudomonadota bacterium]
MDGRNRSDVEPGLEVNIILKKDQRSGIFAMENRPTVKPGNR